jgi:WD40 repeat protein
MSNRNNKPNDKPQIFAVKRDKKGLSLSRRAFISSSAMAMVGCTQNTEQNPSVTEAPKGLEAHSRSVLEVVFSSDGKQLASRDSRGRIKVWSVKDGKLLHTLNDIYHTISSIAFSPDGSYMAVGCPARPLQLWSLTDRSLLETKETADNKSSDFVAFSPDGKFLATANWDSIDLRSAADSKYINTLRAENGTVYQLYFSSDGKLLASRSGYENVISLWSVSDEKLLKTIKYRFINAGSFAINHDLTMLVSGGIYGKLSLFSFANGRQVNSLKSGHKGEINCLVFSPDGSLLVSGGKDHEINIRTMPGCKHLNSLKGHTDEVSSLAISPDGRFLASGSYDNTVKLWSLDDGKFIKNLFDPELFEETEMLEIRQMDDQLCICDTVVVVPGSGQANSSVCVCNTIKVGGAKHSPSKGSSGSGSYWYPN